MTTGPLPTTPIAATKSVPLALVQKGHKGAAKPDETEDLDTVIETHKGSYRAALTLTGSNIPLPVVATIITALFYIALFSGGKPALFLNWPDVLKVLAIIGMGTGLTLVLWLLVALGFMPFTSFDAANATSANHFKRHFSALKSLYKTLKPHSDGTDVNNGQNKENQDLKAFRTAYSDDYQIALTNIYECLINAKRLVRNGKHIWVQSNGYLSVWQFIHRAEEAMLTVAPRDSVIREAMHDAAAIKGTDILDHDNYQNNLSTAVHTLSPSSAIYLKSLPQLPDKSVVGIQQAGSNEPVSDEFVVQAPFKAEDKVVNVEAEMAARSALRHARNVLNEYRSNLWDNLIRVRSQLIGTALGTGLLTFFLLCVSISASARPSAILAGLVFYLVGAISGLFGRLFLESQSDRAIDDYGLTTARVVVTPVISGLAAIAGVLVVSLLSVNLLNTPGQDIKGVPLPDLTQIYDIVQNRQGLVIAALFGLAPNRFISILQIKAEGTKAQLKNSGASQGQSQSA